MFNSNPRLVILAVDRVSHPLLPLIELTRKKLGRFGAPHTKFIVCRTHPCYLKIIHNLEQTCPDTNYLIKCVSKIQKADPLGTVSRATKIKQYLIRKTISSKSSLPILLMKNKLTKANKSFKKYTTSSDENLFFNVERIF